MSDTVSDEAPALRYRRRPATVALGAMAAVILLLAGLSADQGAWSTALIVLAPVALLLGILGRRRWIEDQIIADGEVAVVRRDGDRVALPLDGLVRVVARPTAVRFTAADGAVLEFDPTPWAARIAEAMRELAPQALVVDETHAPGGT